MKKITIITLLVLLLATPALAATNDFTANGDITVSSVAGDVTANMLIQNGSTAESWSYSGGVFTIINPGTFKVSSPDAAVKSIKVRNSGGTIISCADKSGAGADYVTLPTASGTYTVEPSTTVNCSSLCSAITGIETYYQNDGTYNLPSCGAATCSGSYSLSATPASTSTTCNAPSAIASGGGGGGGGGGSSATPTTTTTPPATPSIPAAPATPIIPIAAAVKQWQNILSEAAIISGNNMAAILSSLGQDRNISAETNAAAKYTVGLTGDLKSLSDRIKTAVTNFIAYGTITTKKLGAGERAGVVSSYKKAFGNVPADAAQWRDAIAIANGRWPNVKSAAAETEAVKEFKKIYKREPNRKNAKDDAAVTIISYGLRPIARNTNSEKSAIKSFKAVYGHAPISALAWDIVRAIAYSGAKR